MGAAGPLLNAASLAYDLLLKFPPPGIMPGNSWVDTTTYAGEDATGSVAITWVGTSTLMGGCSWSEPRRMSLSS